MGKNALVINALRAWLGFAPLAQLQKPCTILLKAGFEGVEMTGYSWEIGTWEGEVSLRIFDLSTNAGWGLKLSVEQVSELIDALNQAVKHVSPFEPIRRNDQGA